MQVAVLGAGVVGITTAHYLLQQGHDVTVVDRENSVAAGCSFANGAQLSYSYVDAMDFAYYSGHGNNYYLGMGPGAAVSGVNLDTNVHARWGDTDLEFVVFQSCTVIPSAADRADWADAWVPNGIFQGLHQAIGYRTLSYSGNGISNNFGDRISDGEAVWQAWFAAVNDERSWWRGQDYPGLASAMMHPTAQNDTYYSFVADPPAGHTALTNWYQHW